MFFNQKRKWWDRYAVIFQSSVQYDYLSVPSHTNFHRSNQVTTSQLVNKLQVGKVFFSQWSLKIICFFHLFQLSGYHHALFPVNSASLVLPPRITPYKRLKLVCICSQSEIKKRNGTDMRSYLLWDSYAVIFKVGQSD